MLFSVKANTPYTFSSNLNINIYRFGMAVSTTKTYPVDSFTQDTGWVKNQTYQYTPNTDGYLSIILGRIDNTAIVPEEIESFWFQIEEGSTATEYEPYGYKIPIVKNGKNLLDSNFKHKGKLPNLYGEFYTNVNYNTTDYFWLRAGTYTLSYDNTYTGTSNTTTRIIAYNRKKEFDNVVFEYTGFRPAKPKYTFTLSKDCYVTISLRITDVNIQLEEGNTATEYVPYVSKEYNIYIKEPLRKVGV